MAADNLIANRRYILAADVAYFNRRFALDEFAGKTSNLSSARSTSSNETKYPTSLMLNGVGDMSGAILLFGVRPFAEKFQTRYRYYKLRVFSIADPRPRGWGSIFIGVSRTGQGLAEVKNHANRRISPRNGGLVRRITGYKSVKF